MSYFGNNNIEEEERRNDAFTNLCALRDALTIGKRNKPVSYRETLEIVHEINPKAYKEISSLLKSRKESEIIKYYFQKAEALSNSQKQATPQELIEKDIEEEKKLLNLGEDDQHIRRKIWQLEAALDHFKPEDISENSLLNHDFNLDSRHAYFRKKIYNSAKVKDYQLPGNRVLRLRLLHPDKAEKVIGSDLVYEQFDLKKERVRFIHLQYKTWNAKKLYLKGNTINQIHKLEKNICQSGYCNSDRGKKHSENYRFPFCTAFLRPTNFISRPDAALISSGIHIPVCMVRKIQATGQNQINKINCVDKSIGQRIFEELFIGNHIGSRWMPISELEKFYKDKGITSETGRIRVHAQEVIYQTGEEKNA